MSTHPLREFHSQYTATLHLLDDCNEYGGPRNEWVSEIRNSGIYSDSAIEAAVGVTIKKLLETDDDLTLDQMNALATCWIMCQHLKEKE